MAVALACLVGCGTVPNEAGANTSPTYGSPSSSPTISSNPDAFAAGDCTYPSSGGSSVGPIGPQGMDFTKPQGWTQENVAPPTKGYGPTVYAILDAPPAYEFAPTQIAISRAPTAKEPYPAGTTAVQVADDVYSAQVAVAGGATACTIDGDSAAFFSVNYDRPSMGQRIGTWVIWLHQGLVYGLGVEGNGGTATSAVHDAKELLSSVTWSSPGPSQSPS